MAYGIVLDPVAGAGIAALPPDARGALDVAMDVIRMVPWRADPVNKNNPDGAVRRLIFGRGGAGMVVYLIVEDAGEVHVLQVHWLG